MTGTTPDLLKDRVRGTLVGLAAGDALGTTNEFKPPGTFRPLTDMVGGGPFGLTPGQWTDDTAMALCLAGSLIACGGLDPADQMRRYVRWMRDGHLSSTGTCFDIGNTTRAVLTRFERTGEAVVESTDRNQAANGSLMRLAPVPMMFWRRDDVTDLCGESSRTTHPSPVPVDTCRYMGALIAGAIRGASKDELLRPLFSLRPDEWTRKPLEPEVADVANGSYLRKQPPQVRGTGYCVDALEAALWAFSASDDFRSGHCSP